MIRLPTVCVWCGNTLPIEHYRQHVTDCMRARQILEASSVIEPSSVQEWTTDDDDSDRGKST